MLSSPSPLLVALSWVVAAVGCGGGGGSPDGGGQDADGRSDADGPAEVGPDSDLHDGDRDGWPFDGDRPGPCDPESLEVVDRGLLEVGSEAVEATVERCSEDHYLFVAASGSTVTIQLTLRGLYPALVAVAYPDAPGFDRRIAVARSESRDGPALLELEAPRSGELVLMVRPEVPDAALGYTLELSCSEGCDLETTRYPIVMVHGWTGFESIGPIDYFFGIPDLLRGRGYALFVAELDPYNSVEVRSEELAEQIDGFLAAGHARKVSLIVHSQGGLDSRRAISTLGYGDRVASLVTVATPHRGTPITDVALGVLPGDSEEALYFLLDLVGAAAGSESDAEASFRSLSQQYVQGEFNPSTPDDPRVEYVSWTGRTCLYGVTCDDVCDVEIRLAYDVIYALEGPNDGMVPVSSGAWGDFRGEIPADHFDEVGQLFGVTGPAFEHEDFYLGLARDLAADGH